MTFTDIPDGTTDWGSVLNNALDDLQAQITDNHATDQSGGWQPADQGLIAWTLEPGVASGSTGPTSGQMALARVAVRRASTITNINVGITAAIASGVAGQNFMGIYSSGGALLGQTADLTTAWGSTGPASHALTAQLPVAAGYYWIAMLSNATTTPTVSRGSAGSSATTNTGTTSSTRRFATYGSGLTALPSSITPSSMTAASVSWIFSIS